MDAAWGASWADSWGVSWGFAGPPSLNTEAATDVPTNYVICSRTGFKLPARGRGSISVEHYGTLVRPKSYEARHPQDSIRSPAPTTQRGPERPEQNDVFLSDNAVQAEDL